MHSTEPIKALPFSLRRSVLSNSDAPMPLNRAPPKSATLDFVTTVNYTTLPLTEATAPTPSTSTSPSFHDFLAGLPPRSYIPLEVVPRQPDEIRRPFKLNIKLGPSLSREFVKPAIVASTKPQRYVHRIHTESASCSHYQNQAHACAAEHGAGTAFTIAELERSLASCQCEPSPSHRSTSISVYHPENREYGETSCRADLEALSSSSESDVDSQLDFGDEDYYDPDLDCPATGTSNQASTFALVAGGTGYLVGSALRAAFAAMHSVAGGWSCRNTGQ
ncbi:hypothetical protein C8Q72DRAFT_521948 [Fomitopsis betulina]|nr:hypothetical protein C8Q72DRAFT_521948 [Fomitopsis betulina]